MALQYLVDQSNRILEATVSAANAYILEINALLHAQQTVSMQLAALVAQKDVELANKDLAIAQLQEQVTALHHDLSTERRKATVMQVSHNVERRQQRQAGESQVTVSDAPESIPMERSPGRRGRGED